MRKASKREQNHRTWQTFADIAIGSKAERSAQTCQLAAAISSSFSLPFLPVTLDYVDPKKLEIVVSLSLNSRLQLQKPG
jgi:hypothetical protein